MNVAVQEVQYCRAKQFSEDAVQEMKEMRVWHPTFLQLCTAFYAAHVQY